MRLHLKIYSGLIFATCIALVGCSKSNVAELQEPDKTATNHVAKEKTASEKVANSAEPIDSSSEITEAGSDKTISNDFPDAEVEPGANRLDIAKQMIGDLDFGKHIEAMKASGTEPDHSLAAYTELVEAVSEELKIETPEIKTREMSGVLKHSVNFFPGLYSSYYPPKDGLPCRIEIIIRKKAFDKVENPNAYFAVPLPLEGGKEAWRTYLTDKYEDMPKGQREIRISGKSDPKSVSLTFYQGFRKVRMKWKSSGALDSITYYP